jgi:hypothetical protein
MKMALTRRGTGRHEQGRRWRSTRRGKGSRRHRAVLRVVELAEGEKPGSSVATF